MPNFLSELIYFTKYPKRQMNIWKLKLQQKKSLHYYQKAPDDFSFPETSCPLVSIIIPVYNQYQWTLKCLYSIKQNIDDINYEIIIADDCSTDQTAEILKHIKNIQVIKTPKNSGFLKNCNNAIPHAKGKYIWLLNNDTQVLPKSLSSMLKVFEMRKDTGGVGSKLIYPNGLLQEAGGIIYNDATGCNYGKNKNRFDSEFNYLKEVDYCSGASLLIKTELINEINGFDELFIPAYYEETDLCFRIREKGLKIYYQPLSEVIHFEKITFKKSSIDLIEKNQKKFEKKWHTVLKGRSFNETEIFKARDCSQNKKMMLVLDEKILTPDKNCGNRSTFQYLKYLSEKNLSIKFLPQNQKFIEADTRYLNEITQLGIEVIINNPIISQKNFLEKWFANNGKFFDYVLINRPDVWEAFYHLIKDFMPNAKIIFQGHDIHFLREDRNYQLKPTKKQKAIVDKYKKLEVEIWGKANVIWYFSDKEIEVVHKLCPNANAMNVPLYLYDAPKSTVYNAKSRKDLLFVGGFGHAPNIDAVEWFIKDIFLTIQKSLPEIKINIVGNKPPKNLLELQNESIIFKGFVTDKELDELYSSSKIVVAPLRFGAGVKGKIIEAILNKVPVITTPIGVEGIINENEIIQIGTNSDELAAKIINLYKDDEKLNEIANQSSNFIEKYFSKEKAKAILEKTL